VVEVLKQLLQREIEARYRGSVLGVLWSFLTPLLLLAIFYGFYALVLRRLAPGPEPTFD